MSLEKKLKDSAFVIGTETSSCWVVRLSRINEQLGVVAKEIREIFAQEEYKQLSREDYERLKNRVLGRVVDSGTLETLEIMQDKKLMKKILDAWKKGSKTSPYKPLVEKKEKKP